MSDLHKQLRDVRPPLRDAAPLTYYVTLGYAAFNLILGGLLLFSDLGQLLTFVGVLVAYQWGIVFISFGIGMFILLYQNRWIGTRRFILFGVAIKTMWLLELVAQAMQGGSWILVFIWALLLYLQFVSYVYFTPVNQYGQQ